jgi:mono/diheme cytochrome c family protein
LFHPLRAALAAALIAATAVAAPPGPPPGAPPDEPLPGDFIVVKGRVDRGTYTGWRLFQGSCQSCHGVGGVGSARAPNLVERVKTYTPRGFAGKVLTSYRVEGLMPDNGPPDSEAEQQARLEQAMRRERTARGQPLMPAWEQDAGVPPHVLDLYAYLSARAAGGLGPGQPRLLPRPRR